VKFESLKKPLSLSLLLVFLYVIAILLMCYLKIITLENLILSFATAFGWLIALVIAIIHLSGARSDNQAALEYEIRKNIEIEAFKDINRAVDELSSKIGSVSNVFLSLPINYKSHKENPLIVKFDKIQLS